MTTFFYPEQAHTTLFQSPAWHQAWHHSWRPILEQDPQLNAISVAGAYQTWASLKGIIPVCSLVPFGCQGPRLGSMRSEYWHQVAAIDSRPPSIEGWLQRALPFVKHQLLLPDVQFNSASHEAIRRFAAAHKLTLLERNESFAYAVDCQTQSFTTYLAQLGSSSRLKLFNRRKRLAQVGRVRVVNRWPDITGFIEQINGFHQSRWGRPCFTPPNRIFIEQLLTQLVADGHRVDLSTLIVDEQVVSVLLDLTVNKRTYNLQGGFLESRFNGISLGTLHFGYQIEKAFLDPDVLAYDFMAGDGKNTNYKEKLATLKTQLVDLALVKSRWLAACYRLNAQKNRLLD